jgi:hypothetical protein
VSKIKWGMGIRKLNEAACKANYERGYARGKEDGKNEAYPLVSFAVYYQERLEYWKEKAKDELRPEPYRIVIFLTNRTQRCREFPDKAAHDAAFSKWTDPKSGAIVLDDGESIERHAVVSIVPDDGDGHPSPYTPAEIEAWAKEKVEEEMKGWRVVEENSILKFSPPAFPQIQFTLDEHGMINATFR